MKRDGEPWMSGADYGRSLRGFGVNLLVKDIARSVAFQTEVLAVEVVYRDEDFAVIRHHDADGRAHEWMLHADHSFSDHPLLALTGDGALRGVGVELRLYEHDPDAAEARAAVALQATSLCHGQAAAEEAAETARATFEEGTQGTALPTVAIAQDRLESGIAAFEISM